MMIEKHCHMLILTTLNTEIWFNCFLALKKLGINKSIL